MTVKGWVGFSHGKLHKYSPEYNGEIAFTEFYTNRHEAGMSYADVRRATLTIEPKGANEPSKSRRIRRRSPDFHGLGRYEQNQ